MTRFAAILAIWLLALATIALLADEHKLPNAGAPVVKSAAAQGDIAKVNYWLSPCPADRRNLPRTAKEEQA